MFVYRVLKPLRSRVRGRRVAIVNDLINAGSAIRGAFIDLHACGATVPVIGSLAVPGTAMQGCQPRVAPSDRIRL